MKILEMREYQGRNIYSHRPVVKATLDLGELGEVWSDCLPGFAESLRTLLPGLTEHHCSRGYPGGFLERLSEGTLLGHVIEHVALELQARAGFAAVYGKTLSTDKSGIYEIVTEARDLKVAGAALSKAVDLVARLVNGGTCNIKEVICELKEIAARNALGPSTEALISACRKRDIPVLPLGPESFFQLGYGIKQRRIEASITGFTSCLGVDIACSKEFTKRILSEAGIAVPRGVTVQDEEQAVEAAFAIGRPVVVKPKSGNQGKGVSLNLSTEEEIKAACRLAKVYCNDVIVESYVTGKHYRLLVVNNKVAAASEKMPACVVGDGIHSITELITAVNEAEARGEGHEKSLTKIKLDPQALFSLARQGIYPDTVLEAGRKTVIRECANLSTGGTASDVTELVHPGVAALAVRAAAIVGIDVTGIDIVTPDISEPPEAGLHVIEVNAAPGLRMHLYPSAGRSRNVAEEIVNYLFPEDNNGKIPIISITGTNGKTTATRLAAHIAGLWGKCAGMATTGGIYIGGECIVRGDTTGPQSAQIVLRDPRVELAVLETARGGILRAGLGYDKAQVGVITNISEDHLGLGGVRDLEELTKVKSLVIEALEKNGTAVLNADDPQTLELSSCVRENLILFSLSPDNLLVQRHLSTGQTALFVRRGQMVLAQGASYHNIINIKDIPIGMKGLAAFNISNALAAAAACLSVGIPLPMIRQGLESFGLSRQHNPGRCQLYKINGISIILDYGHNAAAYESVLAMAKKLKPVRLIGVIGVPGDRRDLDIVQTGLVAGKYLDLAIIKEDLDLRGRKPGETSALLVKGLEKAGMAPHHWNVLLRETAAASAAWQQAQPGDCVVIFYEHLSPLQALFDTLEKGSSEYFVEKM